ncbi:MAG TPA: hypothetical protein DCZ93_12775 [Elusimicrobia bacterium]|jgi:hypothetical protein|nr:hypothetical protein [Elusimicrobiota bacterium]
MLKRKWLKLFKITPGISKVFIYLGAGTAFILAALSTPLFFSESPFGWRALPDTIILLLGGWGILKGNRLVSVILPAYMIASRYMVSETFGRPWLDVKDLIVFLGYFSGIIGTFGRDRAERIKAGLPDKRWLDKDIASYFILSAGMVGLCFGILIGVFSLRETGPFTHFNIADSLLIICFAWYTLKRRLWAAGSQVILNMLNTALSYINTGATGAVLGFLPLFLLEVFILGFIGVAVLCGQRQEELDAV